MNKHKFKILPENKGFIGYALINDEVVYTTKLCTDAIAASRDLARFAASQQGQRVVDAKKLSFNIQKENNPATEPRKITMPTSGRRCCGRG